MIRDYEYIIEDYTKASAQTIPEENFEDGVWIYKHQAYVKKLTQIVEEAKRTIPTPIAE